MSVVISIDEYEPGCCPAAYPLRPNVVGAFVAILIGLLPFSVAGARAAVLIPGDGFDCPTAQPLRTGRPQDYGSDANSIARWDVVPYQSFSGELEVGVVAFHIAGIDRVEFSAKAGPWVSIASRSVNTRTRVNEYCVTVNAGDFHDGPIELRAVAYPVVGKPRILEPLFLNANASGALTGNTVYVSQRGSDSELGTIDAPMATITGAIDRVSDGGRVVLTDKGVFELDSGERIRSKRLNELYITIEPAESLDANDVVIGFKKRRTARPYVRRLHFKNLTIDFSTIQQYYPHGTTWFERCRWYQSDGAAAKYRTITYPVRVADHPYYVTDSLAEDMLYGFAGAALARNCQIRRISGDVLQNVQCALNCAVENIDGGLIEHHTDILQMTLHGNNRIVYGLDVRRIVDTQCVFLDHYRASHTDCAFVNIGFDSRDANGGPPFTQFNAPNTNILFRNVRWPGQKIIFRTDFAPPKQFVGRNVLFENCRLYPTDYTRYVAGAKSPPGVVFKNCHPAGREPLRDSDPLAATGIAAAIDKEVFEGQRLAFDLPATNAQGDPVTYLVRNLPDGAAFSKHTFAWTPRYDQAGTYQLTFVPSGGGIPQAMLVTINVWNAGRSSP